MKTILPATWTVPERFKQRLGESAGRQRAMSAEGHLLLILHAPPGPDDHERAARLFWKAPDGKWLSNALGGGVAALRKHLDEFRERLESLEVDLQKAEEARDYFDLLQA